MSITRRDEWPVGNPAVLNARIDRRRSQRIIEISAKIVLKIRGILTKCHKKKMITYHATPIIPISSETNAIN